MNKATFGIEASWVRDGLTPAGVGESVLAMLRRLEPLSPSMSNWLLVDAPRDSEFFAVPLAQATKDIGAFVEHSLVWKDFDEPMADPEHGYRVIVRGSKSGSEFGAPDTVDICVNAGSKWINDIDFGTGLRFKEYDPTLVTYPIYGGALEVLATVWPCPWALARVWEPDVWPVDRPRPGQERNSESPFEIAWIAYLSAPLAAGLAPPPEIASKPTPGGGVVLSTVETRLDPADTEHMRRSRMLQAILEERVGRDDTGRAAWHAARAGPY